MEFRKIFDTIPEQFDKFRPRYSQELFDSLIAYAKIGPDYYVKVQCNISFGKRVCRGLRCY